MPRVQSDRWYDPRALVLSQDTMLYVFIAMRQLAVRVSKIHYHFEGQSCSLPMDFLQISGCSSLHSLTHSVQILSFLYPEAFTTVPSHLLATTLLVHCPALFGNSLRMSTGHRF